MVKITHFWSCGPDWQGPDTVCSELTKVLGYVSKIMPMVLGKLPGLGRPTIWMRVGQGPTALAIGAVGVVWTIFLSSIISIFFLSFSLWETARYRLKYCLKGPLGPKQPTQF